MARKLNLREQLVAAAKLYCKATGRSMSAISNDIYSSGARFARVTAGADLSTASWERGMQWLSDRWPEDVKWPNGVIRLDPDKRRSRRPASAQASA